MWANGECLAWVDLVAEGVERVEIGPAVSTCRVRLLESLVFEMIEDGFETSAQVRRSTAGKTSETTRRSRLRPGAGELFKQFADAAGVFIAEAEFVR